MDSKDNKIESIDNFQIMGDWIPRKVVKEFFNYGNTKMSTFATDHDVRVSKVGKRIFYKYSDLIRVISEGQKNDNHE